jgi:chitinase
MTQHHSVTRREDVSPEELAHSAALAAAGGGGVVLSRRLSWLRVGIMVAIVLAAAGGTAFALRGHGRSDVAVRPVSFFMPYVDVTATPEYAFEDPSRTAARDVVLSFVVSAPKSSCAPSWGAAYSLDAAATNLDLDRRIARLRQRGGDVVVSFGGVANSELALGCSDVTALASAYRSVVTRYSLRTIDLDIEGSAASAAQVDVRRAQAIAVVQAAQRAAGRPLSVWLTLPVGQSGLTDSGLAVLDAMLSAGVEIAGVNALTMDYGLAPPAGSTVTDIATSSLVALSAQLGAAYAKTGRHLSTGAVWQHIGATPMIGQNDTASERFDLADARRLLSFATEHHAARLSMWSLNRDQDCGPNYANVQVVSDQCSGVGQTAGAYTKLFLGFGQSTPEATGGSVDSSSPGGAPTALSTASSDNAATSPYEIWNAVQAYPVGTKVVWHHNVYQAKWYTQAETPDAPVASTSDTPWTLIGPVLPGEHPAPLPTLPAGTYPEWNANTAYQAGKRVLFHDVGYVAKWWTKGDVPNAVVPNPAGSPWQLLTSAS